MCVITKGKLGSYEQALRRVSVCDSSFSDGEKCPFFLKALRDAKICNDRFRFAPMLKYYVHCHCTVIKSRRPIDLSS